MRTRPGGTYSAAYGINELGQIVGISNDATNAFNATLWNTKTGTITDLGTLPGFLFSVALGINSQGQVVGYSSDFCRLCEVPKMTTIGPKNNATLWNLKTGEIIDLGTLPGGKYSYAHGINELGQIAGTSYDYSWNENAIQWNASTGAITDLGALPGFTGAANGINNAGQIVGLSFSSSTLIHNATLWDRPTGTITDLGTLPGFTRSVANGINDFGQIVGGSGGHLSLVCIDRWYVIPLGICDGFFNATLWNSTGAITELGAPPGFALSAAFSINNYGQIVGESYDESSGTINATLWKVSVPSTTPVEQIQKINANIQNLISSSKLDQGQGKALTVKLDAATERLNALNKNAGANVLRAFINQVQSCIDSGKLTAAQGQQLIDEANALINQLK